ncbi:enoyl-CoA hydratase-related protein [Ralstonia sp. 1138]|uniref:enoyl-CoA hydratase-related protein n=1 Tax=Ralstonia sp. 1138 TaxID=3156423 RepID=UPI0033961B95
MNDSSPQISRDDRGVLRVTLNRPDVLNAFDEALIERITQTFEALRDDSSVRVVVLESTGRTFCAGADVGWMRRAAANDQAANLEDARRFASMMAAIDQCPQPVIARIQGAAYGGGVGLACAADIAIASERARFSVSEAKFGILPAVIGPYLINAVGLRQARRLALTCTLIKAEEALAIGLAQQVTSEHDLDRAVQADQQIRQVLNVVLDLANVAAC